MFDLLAQEEAVAEEKARQYAPSSAVLVLSSRKEGCCWDPKKTPQTQVLHQPPWSIVHAQFCSMLGPDEIKCFVARRRLMHSVL